jgi:hypothetical protein
MAKDARTLGEVVRSRGYAVALVPRWITHDLALTRVEIKDLVDESAVRRAWETARAATWLPPLPEDTLEGGPEGEGAYEYSIW